MKTMRVGWEVLLLVSIACGSPVREASAATSVSISLVRAEAPDQSVATVERGSVVPYSRYRGPVTTWAFGLSVDGQQFFDEQDAQGKIVRRPAQLDLDLADGEHLVEPVGYKFRVAGGKVESLSPELSVNENRLSLRLFAVKFLTPDADGPPMPVRVRIATPRGELFHSLPATYAAPLVVYLPAAPSGGYTTNLSQQRLLVSEHGVSWAGAETPIESPAEPPAAPAVVGDGFTIQVPTVRITAVLLLDEPASVLAVQLSAREEATQNFDFEPKLGNWDPRPRFTAEGRLSFSQAGWTLMTGLHEWKLTADEQARFRHHLFLVDRPKFHLPGGQDQERVLHLALGDDSVTAGQRLPVRWRWIGQKGLDPATEKTLVAFWQQAPNLADDAADWRPLAVVVGDAGQAILTMPATLAAGRAWLRVGLANAAGAKPTDRLLAELPLVVNAPPSGAEPRTAVAASEKPIVIGGPSVKSRVPDAYRQGIFLAPQNISAVDISPDGNFVGATTMAFRHDKNFWLLSDDGQILWGRHVDPWAPFQAAVLPEGQACAVGLAYSRFTDPSPTVAVFPNENGDETPLVDVFWDMGWLRYGSGDWRTGWPASLVGDVMVRAGGLLFTVCSHEGGRRFTADGKSQNYPLSYQRPYRMALSADGHVLAFGYLTPDASTLDETTRSRMRLPPAMLTTRDALTSADLWAVAADSGAAPVARPPEAADDFPELATEFNVKPQTLVPFRAPLSVSLNSDGSTTAVAEYGGWVRVKGQRGIGSWNPDHQVFYCPRQRGRLCVFGPRGETLAETDFPADGLFELHLDRQGETVWCAPQAWFARGLAGRSWLPADPAAGTIFAFDLRSKTWRTAWQFPDAVSDLAIASDGRQVLVSCWDGKVYLVGADGRAQADVDVGDAARVAWSADGRFAVAGTQSGEVWSLDARGQVRWHTALPITPAPKVAEAAKPVFDDVPIYSVGRVGTEHAYVGDMWLIKTAQGALMVDGGGSSAIPLSWQRMRTAGVEPDQLHYALLSHSHGDHGGAMYLWRTAGAKIVAPETAALTMNWLMPTWTDYSIWVPTPIDVPLPLKRVGDEAEVTLCGMKIKAIFVPGHSFDSVVYVMDFGDKQVAFTGDIGFEGESHILHRTWGDLSKAQAVTQVLRDKVLPLKPDHVFTGHSAYSKGTQFLESLVERTEAAMKKSP